MNKPAESPNNVEASVFRKLRFTADLFAEFQRKRASEVAEFQNRDKISLTMVWLIFILITSYLLIIGWQREHTSAYLATKKSIIHFTPETRDWHISHMPRSACSAPENCYDALKSKALIRRTYESLLDPAKSPDTIYNEPSILLVRTTIKNLERQPVNSDYLAIGMPSAYYDKAYAFINGVFVSAHLLDSRIGLNFYMPTTSQDDLIIEMLYETDGSQRPLFIAGDEEPLLITSIGEYRAWVRMLQMQDARQGGWLTDMSFIVMAALFLMIFLFVDRSPEVLGLALFMGFEATARSLDYGWLPINRTYALNVFLSGASDIMRVYYVVQICRIGSPKPKQWIFGSLGFGLAISAGSWLRQFGVEFTPDYSEIITASVSILLSTVGVFLLVSTAHFIRGKGLRWRQWALVTAALACLLQAYGSLDSVIPEIGSFVAYYQARSIILPLSTYLLAASAFINISSLENRVRMLSRLQAKNDEIEKELQLGQLVQSAFMKLPELPQNIDFAYYYEPAFFVSGDAYFVEWDHDRNRLVVILGDMTGHGVQAALKSTTMQTLARSFFRSKRRSDAAVGARFGGYKETLGQLFQEAWGAHELPTFIAAEVDTGSGDIFVLRSNFPFALLISRPDGRRWTARVINEKENLPAKLALGAFIVFASDGLFDSSRRTAAIRREVESVLNHQASTSADDIKNLILGVVSRRAGPEQDDRSMIIFSLKQYSPATNRQDSVA